MCPVKDSITNKQCIAAHGYGYMRPLSWHFG